MSNANLGAEKSTLGFLADVLYLKGIICFEFYEAIMSAKTHVDLDAIVEKELRGEFNVYRKGETYIDYTRG